MGSVGYSLCAFSRFSNLKIPAFEIDPKAVMISVMNKIKTGLLAKLICIFCIFFQSLSYADKNEISLFKEDFSKNLTRGGAKIGDIEVDENLTNFGRDSFPLGTLEMLDNIPSKRAKTRGLISTNIYKNFSDSVVLVFNDKLKAHGSGSIINKKLGAVITNWHVIQGTNSVGIVIKYQGQKPAKSDVYPAAVVGYDATRDLALLKISGVLPERINQISLGNKLPEVGSDVHAIGHPRNFAWTYSKGYVSQVRDKFKWSYKNTKHEASIIQTQTPISTGNSGGPLIDNDGYLIGVNSFKSKGENLNFAVTSLEVVDFIKGLKTSLKKEPEKRKPKVNKKIAKKVDTNGDGKADTFYVDENGDGKIDFVLKDSDHNGKPDMIGRDTNGDGKPDLIAVDRGEDGTIDVWYGDTDYDGKVDVSGIDTNGDGKPDKFKKIG